MCVLGLEGERVSIVVDENAYPSRHCSEESHDSGVPVDPEALTQLENRSGVQSIVPYAPYFKISEGLLPSAVDQTALLPGTMLSLTVFPGESELAQVALEDLGLAVIKATSSPFGEQYVVHAFPGSLTPLANLDLVQWIEPWFHRALSSDLTRVRAAIDTDSTNLTNDNHHVLSGSSILININDTAVDSGHPDFDARVCKRIMKSIRIYFRRRSLNLVA